MKDLESMEPTTLNLISLLLTIPLNLVSSPTLGSILLLFLNLLRLSTESPSLDSLNRAIRLRTREALASSRIHSRQWQQNQTLPGLRSPLLLDIPALCLDVVYEVFRTS